MSSRAAVVLAPISRLHARSDFRAGNGVHPLSSRAIPMSVTEEPQRPDLSALRIHREDDDAKSVAWGTVFGWIVALAVVLAAAYAIYVLWIGPRRAPLVDTVVVKPTVNVSN